MKRLIKLNKNTINIDTNKEAKHLCKIMNNQYWNGWKVIGATEKYPISVQYKGNDIHYIIDINPDGSYDAHYKIAINGEIIDKKINNKHDFDSFIEEAQSKLLY